jgi:hypothetical protein
VFPEEEWAGLVGRAHRPAGDGHRKGFRAADGQILEVLKPRRPVGDAGGQGVGQVFWGAPEARRSSRAAPAKASSSGQKRWNEANIREALAQLGGSTVWWERLTGFEKGQAQEEEGDLLERLFRLVGEQSEAGEAGSSLADGLDVAEMPGSAAMGEHVADRVRLSASCREQVAPLWSRAGDGRRLPPQLLEVWEGPGGVVG